MRRRVLLLCYFYPPLAGGGVHRVLSFTRHLPEVGWDCTVVCAGEKDFWVTDDSLLGRVPAGTEVIRAHGGSALSAWLALRGRGGDRARGRRPAGVSAGLRSLSDWWLLPDSYVGWARRARAAAARRIERGGIDVVLSSSPPDSVHLAARALQSRFGLPWVADFRDPWIGLWFRTPPTAWHRARQAAMERDVLEHADLVLTASRTHADRIGERSNAQVKRVEHLPNGFEPAAITPSPPGAGPGVGDATPRPFTLVYTGVLAHMPDAEVFLDALHDVLARHPEARRRLRVRFAGPFESHYEDRAVALGFKGIVEFQGPRPHGEARELQRNADLLLLWTPRDFPTMVPGKLYEYLESGRPLLAVLPAADEAATIALGAGAERVEPRDRAALAVAIERHYMRWLEHGRVPDRDPGGIAAHQRAALAARLGAMLDTLAGARA